MVERDPRVLVREPQLLEKWVPASLSLPWRLQDGLMRLQPRVVTVLWTLVPNPGTGNG